MRRVAPLALLLLVGCGYRWRGSPVRLPAGAESLSVEMFDNRTAEPNVDAWLTDAFRQQYARWGLLRGSGAALNLVGSVLAVTSGPAYTAPRRDPVYRVTLVVRLRLLRGGALVAEATVSETEEYPSGADVLLTEAQRERALRLLVEVVARSGADALAAQEVPP